MPYNPGVQFDPGIIERGFARTGNAIAGAVQDYGQIKKQDKAAKAIFEALEPEEDGATGALKAHPLGLTRDAFNSLSSRDRIAKISGFMEAEAVKSARRKEQMATQEMQMRGEELGLRKQDAAARLAALAREQGSEEALATALKSALPGAAQGATPEMFAAPGGQPPPTAESLLRALAENPQAINARGMGNVDNLMRALQEGQGGQQFEFNPERDVIPLSQLPGQFFTRTSKGGGQIVQNPEAIAAAAEARQRGSGAGNVKDKDRYTRLSKQLNSLIDAQANVAVLGDTYTAKYQPQIDALVAELKGLEGGTGGGAAAADQADVTQEQYAKLKPGETYWWKGQQLTKK